MPDGISATRYSASTNNRVDAHTPRSGRDRPHLKQSHGQSANTSGRAHEHTIHGFETWSRANATQSLRGANVSIRTRVFARDCLIRSGEA